ncbi:hypothetical protein PTQ17_13975, partial [Escherichia coli]|uniref:hypothetical protein n=1 Tax=Escherichia coli TaxID=562 RepID=UPI0030F064EA
LRREAESPIFLTTLFFLFAIYFSFSFKGKHPEICFYEHKKQQPPHSYYHNNVFLLYFNYIERF